MIVKLVINALIAWMLTNVFKSLMLPISDKIVNGSMDLTYDTRFIHQ